MILLKAKVLYQDRLFVEHIVGQNVDVMAYVKQNWIKLFWAMLKCAHKGPQVEQTALAPEGRHDIRKNDSDNQMKTTAKKTFKQSPKYGDLVSRVNVKLNQ